MLFEGSPCGCCCDIVRTAGACPRVHADTTRLRPPTISAQATPIWHGALDTKLPMPCDSITDGHSMVVIFAQASAFAYPRYIVSLRPKGRR